MSINFHDIRTRVLKALYTDDELYDHFYLKGGAALLYYGIHDRASADIDVSMEGPFEMPLEEVRTRLEKAMISSFDDTDLHVFDFKLLERPKKLDEFRKTFWGGYKLDFKFVTKDDFEQYGDDIDNLRRRAIKVMEGVKSVKRFQVDISNYEYCAENYEELPIDGIIIRIYTPPLIVFEKLRAICQQDERYKKISHSSHNPRPRDFFDIVSVLKYKPGIEKELIKADKIETLKSVFEIKKVPLEFLNDIRDNYAFHAEEFDSVKDAVGPDKEIENFKVYFDRVINLVDQILPLLNV